MIAIDRPAAIRRAMRDLVAERGFHGASMHAVAEAAGVATGTAYVHYASKDELVIATYLEVKSELADAVLATHDSTAPVFDQYRHVFKVTFDHMAREPERARFLTQMEGSPYRDAAHQRLAESEDRLIAVLIPLLETKLIELPPEVIWAMSLGLAIHMAASGIAISESELERLVDATWRSITV
ncbi:MAG: TetR/AcrR family transcriptional regulator [Acidimicrobiia bacterium]|nr:TetR/AcrR family transcriptional regulator [Acidimicrobiia bacterium]MDH4307615.1 TetR/AcrR family transcriptional regulator [Acidimicrobiia bacterium]MDH5294832.1 TetR/AcrR family transcriptional regulator [Acidimicrobiia bacterium]